MIKKLFPKIGDDVKLITKPDGCTSQFYKLTVGNVYQVKDIFGCCVVTNTDDGDTGIYNQDRVQVVSRQP
jgi:hypothetical protein